MKRRIAGMAGLLCLSALIAAGSGWAWAEGDSSAEAAKKAQAKPAKVSGPYEKLDLSAEQRVQIAAIQKQTIERIQALKRQERQQIAAVLTEEQRAKLHRAADHDKLQKRIWGMKGYLKRLENRRDAIKKTLADAEGEKRAKVEAKLADVEQKVADYKQKLAREESQLRALSGDAD